MKALIVARGGSQRLYRKNVLPMCGHPLIAWSIIQASTAKNVDEVFVCADTDEIMRIAEDYGAIPIRGPNWMMKNSLAANVTFKYLMREVQEMYSDEYGVADVVTLLPAGPLRRPGDIDTAIDVHMNTPRINGEWNFVTGLTDQHDTMIRERATPHLSKYTMSDGFSKYGMPVLCTMVVNIDDYFAADKKTAEEMGTEEVTNDGADALKEEFKAQPAGYKYFLMKDWQYFDVDYKADFDLCECLLENMILKGRGTEVYYEYQRKNST